MTSAEIVKALRGDCERCSENIICENITCCENGVNLAGLYCAVKDAADLIERLEKERAALLESIRGGCVSCGVDWFLTRAEAEKALEERKDD